MSWQQTYLNYDLEALALYANIGLIRRARKDIEADKVLLQEEQPDFLLFMVDGQQVKLTAQGIQKVTCSCPASGHCKHIIAAILWLQLQHNHQTDNNATLSQNSATERSVPPLKDALSELLTIDAGALLKQAGKANVRLAYQLVFEWQQLPPLTVENQKGQLRIQIPQSDMPIIYMAGTGFAGMISQLPEKQKTAVHLAVIAYLFQQHHQPWTWPIENNLTDKPIDRLSVDEIALIKQVEEHIYTLITHGLSHVSQSQATQLQLLNMSARSQNLASLAAMLRHLCQLVEQQANRHFTIDEQDILLFLARLKAYLEKLSHYQGEQLTTVRGGQKRHYQNDAQLIDLLPLGAYWWQSKTGAIGATFYFWDPIALQYYETTLARPNNSDINFNRQSLWQSASIWQAMACDLMNKAFTLYEPRLSHDGKLSSRGSHIKLQPTGWNLQQYQQFQQQVGFDNWSLLSHYLQNYDTNISLFNQVLFIHVTKAQKPYLDEIRQCLVWCVKDSQNNDLLLRIFWDGKQKQRIESLYLLHEIELQPLTVLVKCVKNDNNLDLEPFALFYKQPLTDDINILNLDFDNESLYQISNNSDDYCKQPEILFQKQPQQIVYQHDPIVIYIIKPTLNFCETITSSGRLKLNNDDKKQLAQLQNQCDTLGLNTLSQVLTKIGNHPNIEVVHILQAVYLCHLMQNAHYQLPIMIRNDAEEE